MTKATAAGRARLDVIMKMLAQASDGPTLDEFRVLDRSEFDRKRSQIRALLFAFGSVFLALMFVALIVSPFYPPFRIAGVLLWAASLGGIGAVSGLFVHVAGIAAQESMHIDDRFSVLVRIFLGVAFSIVLTTIIVTQDLINFFNYLETIAAVADNATPRPGDAPRIRTGMLLLPFLCGYSIPFVLGLLDKAMEAVQLTIGMELRGPAKTPRRPR